MHGSSLCYQLLWCISIVDLCCPEWEIVSMSPTHHRTNSFLLSVIKGLHYYNANLLFSKISGLRPFILLKVQAWYLVVQIETWWLFRIANSCGRVFVSRNLGAGPKILSKWQDHVLNTSIQKYSQCYLYGQNYQIIV